MTPKLRNNNMLRCRYFLILLFLAHVSFSSGYLNWPLSSDSVRPQVISSYGQYEGSTGPSWLHVGIDIQGYPGEPVTSVENGKVIAIRTEDYGPTYRPYYWHIAIRPFRDTAHAWVYGHVDSGSIRVKINDTVKAGDTIATVLQWFSSGFDHIHFGIYTYHDYDTSFSIEGICNPLLLLKPLKDSIPPSFHSGFGQEFYFRKYPDFDSVSAELLDGTVSISIGARDSTTAYSYGPVYTGVYEIRYHIDDLSGKCVKQEYVTTRLDFGLGTVPNSEKLSGTIYDLTTSIQYANYYLVGDRYGAPEDTNSRVSFDTRTLPNGNYWLVVSASDFSGNVSVDSIRIGISNTAKVLYHLPNTTLTKPVKFQYFDLLGRAMNKSRIISAKIYIAKIQAASGVQTNEKHVNVR